MINRLTHKDLQELTQLSEQYLPDNTFFEDEEGNIIITFAKPEVDPLGFIEAHLNYMKHNEDLTPQEYRNFAALLQKVLEVYMEEVDYVGWLFGDHR